MSWSEKLSIRIARKLVSPDAPQSVGQVSHGIEIFLLYLLTMLSLLISSWLLHTLVETLLLAVCYFVYRNFTGGVHLKHPHTCFLAGMVLILSLGALAKYLPAANSLLSLLLVLCLFAYSFVVNLRYAPANHVYVQISDEAKKRSKKIVIFLLIIGCLLAFSLIYFKYSNLAFAYGFAVALQALLLSPFSFRLVKRLGQ